MGLGIGGLRKKVIFHRFERVDKTPKAVFGANDARA